MSVLHHPSFCTTLSRTTRYRPTAIENPSQTMEPPTNPRYAQLLWKCAIFGESWPQIPMIFLREYWWFRSRARKCAFGAKNARIPWNSWILLEFMEIHGIQCILMNFMEMCGNEADSPPQRRNTPNFDLLFVLFRATWGMWAVWGKSRSRNMISLQKSGKSHYFKIFQEVHAFVWIAMHFMGCTEHQFSLRETHGSGTPFRAKCLKSSKIMNVNKFMGFS